MNIPIMIQNLFGAKAVKGISKLDPAVSGKRSGVVGFAALMGQMQQAGDKDVLTMSGKSPVALKGHALISQLKRNLLSSGVPLDQLTADNRALEAIEKLLVGADFEAGAVRTLIGELKLNAGGKGVKVSTLFEGISRLTEPPADTPKPAYMEISSLPFVETLLAKFGLAPDEIKTALSRAKVEGKGIDAERLAFELKLLQQGGGSRKPFLREDEELEQIVSMMQQIGLTVNADAARYFDLEGLVASLRTFSGRETHLLVKNGASPAVEDNKGSRAILSHLNRMQGQGPAMPASEGTLSPDRSAAAFEMIPGSPEGAGAGRKPVSDWDLFVRNIQPVSQKNAVIHELRAGALLQPYNASSSALLPGMEAYAPPAGNSNPLFTTPGLFQTVYGKTHPTESGVNRPHVPGLKAGIYPAGSPEDTKAKMNAVKSGVPVETALSEAVSATAAKTGETVVDERVRQGRATRKLTDSSSPFLGDGIAGRSERVESTPLSTLPQSAGRMFPYYLLDQVSRQILRSHLTNESEIQIQLKPPSLGRLKMSIENTTEGLKVSIIAESQAARDMLLSNSGDLKTALWEQGIRLERIKVETQADFNQTMADTGHGSNGSDGRKRFSGGNRAPLEAATGVIEITRAPQNEAGVLNLVA